MPTSIAWLLIATAALALAVALTAVRSRRRRAAPPKPSAKPSAKPSSTKPSGRRSAPSAPPQKAAPRPGTKPSPRPASEAGTKRATKSSQTPTKAPAAGEIWWADVPFHGAEGSKVRPCLVLRRSGANLVVLKITSQDQSDRDDHIRIPTHAWDHGADYDSYLDLSDPYTVSASEFERRVGTIDPASWKVVRVQHDVDQPSRS